MNPVFVTGTGLIVIYGISRLIGIYGSYVETNYPYVCPWGDGKFKTYAELLSHMSIHGDDPGYAVKSFNAVPFHCAVEGIGFGTMTLSEMYSHYDTVHVTNMVDAVWDDPSLKFAPESVHSVNFAIPIVTAELCELVLHTPSGIKRKIAWSSMGMVQFMTVTMPSDVGTFPVYVYAAKSGGVIGFYKANTQITLS